MRCSRNRPAWSLSSTAASGVQTPFTRIEQTAIKNRAFNAGYDFTLFIPMTSRQLFRPGCQRRSSTTVLSGSD